MNPLDLARVCIWGMASGVALILLAAVIWLVGCRK